MTRKKYQRKKTENKNSKGNRKNMIKITSIALIILLVVVLTLYMMGKSSPTLLWLFIIMIGFYAYFVLPKMKK